MKFIAALFLSISLAAAVSAGNPTLDIQLKDIDGKKTSLKAHKGKVMLVVNVASKCGLTPQYKQLQAVHDKFAKKGFTVLGFPCNQFGKQEPGTSLEIKKFCTDKYDVTFPLHSKIEVNGDNAHPLYKKVVRVRRKFVAHDEKNDCRTGDRVRIVECRPMSRRKRWRVAEIMERAPRA